jgi:hypothetical protein
MRTYLALTMVLVSSAACSDEAKAPSPEPKSAAPVASQKSTGAHPGPVGGKRESWLKWTAPAALEVVDKPSPMRLATYKFKGPDGDAELSVSMAGGDVNSNVERWKKQFTGEPRSNVEERTVGAFKVTVVTIEGTFTGMAMPGAPAGTPMENAMMLGAIVEGGKGDAHFFKMTGPAKTVDAAKPAFDELIQSFTPAG